MKKCHGEICKVYKVKDDQKITWNYDGEDGEHDLNNLDNLPIKWVTTEGNYSKFHNGKTGMGGSRNKDVCNQIADMITSAHVRKAHMGKQVQSKINHLEKSFWKAYEFSFTETCQGLMEQSKGTFHEAVLKMCPHYFDLFDVMKNCSSSMSQINLEDLDENIVEPLSSSDNDDESVIVMRMFSKWTTRTKIIQKTKTKAVPTAKPVTIQHLKLYQQLQPLT